MTRNEAEAPEKTVTGLKTKRNYCSMAYISRVNRIYYYTPHVERVLKKISSTLRKYIGFSAQNV